MNYYYLASSLPVLSMDTPPAITMEEFLQTCEDHLTESDMKALNALLALDGDECSHKAVIEWRNKETLFRNTIAKLRAIKLNKDPSLYTKEVEYSDADADRITSDAFTKKSPLERERMIDTFRWAQAEELAGFNQFSSEAVLAYGIKLMLAERWSALDEETAKDLTDKIVNTNPEENLNNQEIK